MNEPLSFNIDKLILKEVMERVIKQHPDINAPNLEREYRRFLCLAFMSLQSEQPFMCRPPPLIDEVWHQHILFTRKYAEDCHMIGGTFLHHYPETSYNILNEQEKYDSAIKLLEIYKRCFNEVAPLTYWSLPTKPTAPTSPVPEPPKSTGFKTPPSNFKPVVTGAFWTCG